MCCWVDRISCAATCWWRTVRGLHTPITINMLLNYNLDDVNYTHTHNRKTKQNSYMNMKEVWKMSRTCFTEWKVITADIMWAESETLWCILFMFNLFVYYTYFSFIQWFNVVHFSLTKESDKLLKTCCTLKANNGTQTCLYFFKTVGLLWSSMMYSSCILSLWYCRLTVSVSEVMWTHTSDVTHICFRWCCLSNSVDLITHPRWTWFL